MGHQVIKLQNPLKTLGFLQFYRFKTVKDRIIPYSIPEPQFFSYFPYLVAGIMEQKINSIKQNRAGNAITAFPAPRIVHGSLTVSFQIHFAELQYAQGFKPSFFVKFNAFLCSVCSVIVL